MRFPFHYANLTVNRRCYRGSEFHGVQMNAVERLHRRYAFVVTGTPLENREYYELDAKGHPVGYWNLE